jgi:tetratricopeptide (TPR) repeat protein
LSLLAEIEEAEGTYAAAAELLLRRAKVERARPELGKLLLRLGGLYARHLDDPKRAIACLTRVLQIDPNHRDAIELLAESYAREWDWQNALGALRRWAALESDTHKKIAIIHRAARIEEEGLKQPREALALYRAALQLEPTNLEAVEALGQFFDRQSDTQSLRVLCDTTARRLRQGLAGGPRDAEAFRALARVFALRRAPDRMAIVAGALEWMGSIEPEERRALERLRTREQYPGSALADPALDEMLFDARAPAGFRNMMRVVEDSLMKTFRIDVKQLGLGRGDRLPRSGHAVRDIANRVAADLDVRDFEVYVSAALGSKATLELADPLSVCIGTGLTEGVHELSLRFLFARFFKMAQLRLALASRLAPEALAALTAGIVRQFVPDYQPTGVDPAAVGAEAVRMQKLLPRKLAGELHTFALECSTPSTQLPALSAGLAAAANRAGLLAIGAPGPALAMLERMGLSSEARELALFCVSDELAELRRMVGTSIG